MLSSADLAVQTIYLCNFINNLYALQICATVIRKGVVLFVYLFIGFVLDV